MYGGSRDKKVVAPETLSDEEWGDYLFMRKNTKGVFKEQWNHSVGCRMVYCREIQ